MSRSARRGVCRTDMGRAVDDGRGHRGRERAARAGQGDDTEAIAKGGPQEGEGVYKWLREVIRAQSEGDQRSPQARACRNWADAI